MYHSLSSLDTPAVTVDLSIVERNIAQAQRFYDLHQITFRPHVKTHKIPEFTRWQLAAGAKGICCQKLSEAEVMIEEAGATDIFLPYNIIGPQKMLHLARLLERPGVMLTVGVDSLESAHTAQQAAALAGRSVAILIECDTGGERAGLQSPQQVLELALAIRRECDRVRLDGLFTFPTHRTQTPAFFQAAASLCAHHDLPLSVFSGGGTPGMWEVNDLAPLTEHRAGSYIFHDRNTVGAKAATVDDCALQVICTVVSRPTDTRAIIDGGSKTFSSDLWISAPDPLLKVSYGFVLEYPHAVFYASSEEHGNLDLSACTARPALGERVTIIPNHCCSTMNMHDRVYGIRQGRVERTFLVVARGHVW